MQTTNSINTNSPNENWTLYYKQDSIFHVKRLISDDTGLILLKYDINTFQPEAAKQTFLGSKRLMNVEDAIKEKAQSKNYKWVQFAAKHVLFV